MRVVVYSLPGEADPIRSRLYRTIHGSPPDEQRAAARRELESVLRSFSYRAGDVPARLTLRQPHVTKDYFEQFPGLRADDHYNGKGFWSLPIPVSSALEVANEDVVVFDGEGYSMLRKFLQDEGVEHVLLCGYATDMCVRSTTAGYQNLRQDFNVFLVADATQATFPAARDARYATNQAVTFASLDLLITQASWVKLKADASGSTQ
ncbi:MAG: hypothetical protein KatS3mg110_4326 [Pirellulaceae bacterium]|nr:MAG: hypothetical protein KatS3mg110_4326 [Pirellulaceae bacterium]